MCNGLKHAGLTIKPYPASEESHRDSNTLGDPREESYWREGVLEIRMGWRRTVDMIKDLELENAALRQQFYAEDDPYVRDSQIKPAWDRVLDRLDELRERAVQHEQELNRLVSDGMRAGVPQGWLNQGWELEPTEEEKRSLRKLYVDGEISTHEPVDLPPPDQR